MRGFSCTNTNTLPLTPYFMVKINVIIVLKILIVLSCGEKFTHASFLFNGGEDSFCELLCDQMWIEIISGSSSGLSVDISSARILESAQSSYSANYILAMSSDIRPLKSFLNSKVCWHLQNLWLHKWLIPNKKLNAHHLKFLINSCKSWRTSVEFQYFPACHVLLQLLHNFIALVNCWKI